MKHITFDLSLSLKESGVHGISASELKKLKPRLAKANKIFSTFATQPQFLKILDQSNEVAEINRIARHIRSRFKSLVVIGIGGSDLGARAALQALAASSSFPVYFCGDTTDPQPLEDLLSRIDLSKAAINVISKSGETIETLSTFLIIKEKLKRKVGGEFSKHIFATTSPTQGLLSSMALAEGFAIVPHMPVGGRFSVLSSVGFLPMAVAGINIQSMLRGGTTIAQKTINSNSPLANAPFAFTAINYLAWRKGMRMLVLMPYIYRLQEFSRWFRQLWAESLGKNGLGQTPIASLGPTDQHSQLQLYQDGPNDKIITFLSSTSNSSLSIPSKIGAELSYLKGVSMEKILREEMQATARALAENKKPSNTLKLSILNEESLGELFMFFELATAYSAELHGIDAYDQPGVELSKQHLQAALGKPGSKKSPVQRIKKLIIS